MSEITLTGLTEVQRIRFRFELLQRDDIEYTDSPFNDEAIDIACPLDTLVEILTAVRDEFGEAASAPAFIKKKAKSPSASKGAPKPTSDGKNVRWSTVVASLASGELDEYRITKSRDSAYKLKSNLLTSYPGLDIETVHGDTESVVVIKVGSYEQGE